MTTYKEYQTAKATLEAKGYTVENGKREWIVFKKGSFKAPHSTADLRVLQKFAKELPSAISLGNSE